MDHRQCSRMASSQRETLQEATAIVNDFVKQVALDAKVEQELGPREGRIAETIEKFRNELRVVASRMMSRAQAAEAALESWSPSAARLRVLHAADAETIANARASVESCDDENLVDSAKIAASGVVDNVLLVLAQQEAKRRSKALADKVNKIADAAPAPGASAREDLERVIEMARQVADVDLKEVAKNLDTGLEIE